MPPKEITALFANATTKFAHPWQSQAPLLLSITYDEDGVVPLRNLVGIIELPPSYLTTWHAPFPMPGCPTCYEVAIANNATPVIRTCMEAEHNVLLMDYASFKAAKHAVMNFIRNAIDEIKDLKDPWTFYNSITAMALLAHLDANCGGPHPVDLINLPLEMIG